ncbi:MAG TPA: aminotransferase, partial [Desulfuromonas sp.]|nr:aminotransferase [Desulfuromonas sp.]
QDKRFVYYLLASTGICTVPLTSFCTSQNGFRITLLERDELELTRIFQTIAASVTAYLKS